MLCSCLCCWIQRLNACWLRFDSTNSYHSGCNRMKLYSPWILPHMSQSIAIVWCHNIGSYCCHPQASWVYFRPRLPPHSLFHFSTFTSLYPLPTSTRSISQLNSEWVISQQLQRDDSTFPKTQKLQTWELLQLRLPFQKLSILSTSTLNNTPRYSPLQTPVSHHHQNAISSRQSAIHATTTEHIRITTPKKSRKHQKPDPRTRSRGRRKVENSSTRTVLVRTRVDELRGIFQRRNDWVWDGRREIRQFWRDCKDRDRNGCCICEYLVSMNPRHLFQTPTMFWEHFSDPGVCWRSVLISKTRRTKWGKNRTNCWSWERE